MQLSFRLNAEILSRAQERALDDGVSVEALVADFVTRYSHGEDRHNATDAQETKPLSR